MCVCLLEESEKHREVRDSHTDKVRGAGSAGSWPPPGAPLGFGELHTTSPEQAWVSNITPEAESSFVLIQEPPRAEHHVAVTATQLL